MTSFLHYTTPRTSTRFCSKNRELTEYLVTYYVLTKYVNVSLSSLKNKLLNSVKAISGVTYEIEGGYPFTALKITSSTSTLCIHTGRHILISMMT